MDKISEIHNRWHRVFEKNQLEDQLKELDKLGNMAILKDVKVLQKYLKEVEGRLNAVQNPFSSQVGQITLWEDGELSYRINGVFLKIKDLNDGIILLKKLAKKEKRLTKEEKETLKNLRLGDDIYEDLKKETKDQ